MKHLLLIPFTTSTFVNATSPILAPRQDSCPQGTTQCYAKCIPETWTCCRPYKIACEPDSSCSVGLDGNPGCCQIGKICTGAAPSPTSYISASLFTATADEAPAKTAEADDRQEDAGDDDNAGASVRFDNTLTYFLVVAMALLM